MLECIQVSKSYGDAPVLQIGELLLDKGIHCLRGANGSGKTTFLRMVAGLLPFKGDILLNGCSLHKSPLAYRRKVSWADAEPLYPAFLSGMDLVSFYKGIRKAGQDQVDRLISIFGVAGYLANPIGGYSSGMCKKLSLLLAFIGDTELITLDEPLVTLDADAIPRLYSLINEYAREKNTGFLISSHQELDTSVLPVKNILAVAGQTISLTEPILTA